MRISFDEYEIDTDLYQLLKNGKIRPVEPLVFDLLVYLARNRDRVVSRQELFDVLWSGKVVSEATLSGRIKEARRAIGDAGKTQKYIETVSRRGYRFVGDVSETSLDAVGQQRQFTELPAIDRPAIAVLPFSSNHGNDEINWMAEMLSNDIRIQLARIPGFIVISSNSTARYQGQEFTINQIGVELNADYVVEGSVWEASNRLRVSVQLLQTSTGQFLWADKTEIQADELSSHQDDVVREIVGRIEPELNRSELSTLRRHRPVDLGAWSLYRRGNAILSLKGMSEESFREAADLLRQAISRDPELAIAHAYLSLVLAIGHLVGLVNDEGWHQEAVAAAENAVQLDSQDSDVLGYAGCAFADMGDVNRGIGLIQKAVELNPSNAQAHAALGAVMLLLGKEEGIEIMRHGMRISPKDNRIGVWGALLARNLLTLGKLEEAIETAELACRSDDKIFLPRIVLAAAKIMAGDSDSARTALNDARRIRPQLHMNEIARFTSPEEIARLQRAGIL